MTDMTSKNQQAVDRAEALLTLYHGNVTRGGYPMSDDDRVGHLSGIIADLRLYCAARGIDWAERAGFASDLFDDESAAPTGDDEPVVDEVDAILAELTPNYPLDVTDICARTGLPASIVMGTLMLLEMGGKVQRTLGSRFITNGGV